MEGSQRIVYSFLFQSPREDRRSENELDQAEPLVESDAQSAPPELTRYFGTYAKIARSYFDSEEEKRSGLGIPVGGQESRSKGCKRRLREREATRRASWRTVAQETIRSSPVTKRKRIRGREVAGKPSVCPQLYTLIRENFFASYRLKPRFGRSWGFPLPRIERRYFAFTRYTDSD
ncbi:hypothetical protein RND71_036923 [Anisodus tanguticus]|uniref:Uncharacterized protein n=1 Tax=Anisodus tanguticus TaxID=243964 RepID=A0AAE1R1C6_9SOLA|nr:hypothetical protein RND71_036923 [Anisodus tanguticus]